VAKVKHTAVRRGCVAQFLSPKHPRPPSPATLHFQFSADIVLTEKDWGLEELSERRERKRERDRAVDRITDKQWSNYLSRNTYGSVRGTEHSGRQTSGLYA